MYGVFILPESLPPERRRPIDWKRANPIGSLSLLRSRPGLLGFGLVDFIYKFAHQSLQNVFVLYVGYRYGWDSGQVGLSLALVGVSLLIVQGGLVGPIVSRFGERRALVTGLVVRRRRVRDLRDRADRRLCSSPAFRSWRSGGCTVRRRRA